jgi:hypothetical protein
VRRARRTSELVASPRSATAQREAKPIPPISMISKNCSAFGGAFFVHGDGVALGRDVGNRSPERCSFSRMNREGVPRPSRATARFEPRAMTPISTKIKNTDTKSMFFIFVVSLSYCSDSF